MQFPVHVPVGPWQVHPHIVFEALGYTLGFQLFLLLRRRRGEPLAPGQRPVLVLAAVAGALVGSKLLAWLVDPAALWAHRADWRAWVEGKTIVGGLLGGHLSVAWAKHHLGVARSTGDLYALPLAVGIAVGRIGCFLTGLGDRTYGVATALPWGVDFGDGVHRHPTPLYELAFLAVLALLLWRRMRHPWAEGHLFRLFMASYLGWRLLVGFIQPDATLLGLSAIQWACVAGLC
ncbi:MAG TPA: prolipoprotein diacylglyceryl transferase family protein, partial [Candidatus Thermoplasmatota archaeon]|nr:prolipoprotein diacylglyceryl transferase family protein [Candidatus Thermoplasmatota archaeon]